MEPVQPVTGWRAWRPWIILAIVVVGIVYELKFVSANSDRFQDAWYAFWGESVPRDNREKFVIIDSRPQDRTRASDNVSIGSTVTSPVEHAWQGPTAEEKAAEAAKNTTP